MSTYEYINPLTLEIYNEMLSVLSEEDQQMLSSCYIIDYNFSICSLDPNVMSEDKYRFLTEIFNKTGVIPSKNDESTLIVDIQGINDILVSK